MSISPYNYMDGPYNDFQISLADPLIKSECVMLNYLQFLSDCWLRKGVNYATDQSIIVQCLCVCVNELFKFSIFLILKYECIENKMLLLGFHPKVAFVPPLL